jgi:hypothetical protein
MFLNALNETERKRFLELAYHAVCIDGVVEPREQRAFASYQQECQLPDYAPTGTPVAELATAFHASTKRIRRIVLLELQGLVLADGALQQREADLLQQLATAWEFREAEYRRLRRWTQDFLDLLEDGARIIEGE